MRSLLLLFLIFSLSNAFPSEHCQLSSDRCVEADFRPHPDARRCGPGSIADHPELKECNAIEICTGPSDDEKGLFYCNLVSDVGHPEDGKIEAACKAWKNNEYCEPDGSLWAWIIAGSIAGVLILAFAVYYAISKKHKKIGSVKTSKGGGAKNSQVYKPLV